MLKEYLKLIIWIDKEIKMNNENARKIPFPLLIGQIILGILTAYFVFTEGNYEAQLIFVSAFFLMSGFLSYRYLKNKFQAVLGLALFVINLVLYFTK